MTAEENAVKWLCRSRDSKSPSRAKVHATVLLDHLEAIATAWFEWDQSALDHLLCPYRKDEERAS